MGWPTTSAVCAAERNRDGRGGQQQAGGEAPVRPPVPGEVCHLGRVREVIEAVARLDRVTQG
jgi:hypothetical protein